MLSYTPQNGDEAAYTSFALIAALADLLISKGLITEPDFQTMLETVVVRLEEAPNNSSHRAAGVMRTVLLAEKEFE